MPSHPRLHRKTPPEQLCDNPDCRRPLPPTERCGRPKLYCDAVCQRCTYLYWRARMVVTRPESQADPDYTHQMKSKKFSWTCAECGGKNPGWQRFCCRACLNKNHLRAFRVRRKQPLLLAKREGKLRVEVETGLYTPHWYGMLAIRKYRKNIEERYGSDKYQCEQLLKAKLKADYMREKRARIKAEKWAEENPGPHPDSDFWKL